MQNRDIYLMILGMTLVTYLPRVLPAFLMGRIRPVSYTHLTLPTIA